MVENRNTGATGELAGNLDGVLDGLGARVEKNRLLREVSRGVLSKKFTEANVRFVSRDLEKSVRHALGLLECGLDDGIIGVTDGRHTDTSTEVDDVVAVNVNENRSLCPFDVHGEGR